MAVKIYATESMCYYVAGLLDEFEDIEIDMENNITQVLFQYFMSINYTNIRSP